MYRPDALETYTLIEVQFPPEPAPRYNKYEDYTGIFLLSFAIICLLGALFLWQLGKKD